nr:RDD family protein [uncultured Draconibacterium sp.]
MKIPKILIFNFFTRQSFNGGFNTLQIFGRRLNSMSMDFSFMLGLVFPFFIILFMPIFIIIASSNDINVLFPMWIGIIPFSCITFLILNKDFYNAKSVAKRHFGYQIVDLKTNCPANELQCVIRNSTMIIWPVEVIASMFNSKRRLGDLIAGTKLIDIDKEDPELIMNEISEKSIAENKSNLIWISIFISLLFSALSILPTLLTII